MHVHALGNVADAVKLSSTLTDVTAFASFVTFPVCYPCRSYVFTAAKLIAPVMDKKEWEVGFDWVIETIRLDHEYLASKMEIEKALHYLKTKEFDKVTGVYKIPLLDQRSRCIPLGYSRPTVFFVSWASTKVWQQEAELRF